MSDRLTVISESGLQFFGKVSASLSHEFRNVLATLYENAGLLEDLVLMAEKGRPLDPKRLKDLAGRLKAQVRRGTELAENMNRFAHSLDKPMASVNLHEMLDLVTCLAQRTASVRGVTLQTRKAEPPPVIRVAPFGLENLIWLCLDVGMSAKLTEKTLTLGADLEETGARIRFGGFQGLGAFRGNDASVRELDALAQAVGAVVSLDEENNEVVLSLAQDAGER